MEPNAPKVRYVPIIINKKYINVFFLTATLEAKKIFFSIYKTMPIISIEKIIRYVYGNIKPWPEVDYSIK